MGCRHADCVLTEEQFRHLRGARVLSTRFPENSFGPLAEITCPQLTAHECFSHFCSNRLSTPHMIECGQNASQLESAWGHHYGVSNSVTDELSSEEIIVRLHLAMSAAIDLPLDDAANVEMLVQAGELLVAYQTLCTQLSEYDVPLNLVRIQELRVVGRCLGAAIMYSDVLLENEADET